MNYYNEIKNELINNEVYKKVKDYSKNRNDLNTYYNVGKLLSEAGKHYGEGIIKKYSVKLTNELGKGYSVKSLFKFRKFYNTILKVSTMSRILSWSHYDLLLKFDDIIEFNCYVKITEEQKTAADVDKDSKVTLNDAKQVLKYSLGIITSFEIKK